MRALLFGLLVLAACGAGAKGPAWPKDRVPEVDGGESLAPRANTVAVEQSEDEPAEETAEAEAPKETTETPAVDEDQPETTTDADIEAASEDETITTEELVIEIEEDE